MTRKGENFEIRSETHRLVEGMDPNDMFFIKKGNIRSKGTFEGREGRRGQL